MGRRVMEMGDSCHVTEVACEGSGGFAALGAPAGWLGESCSGLQQSKGAGGGYAVIQSLGLLLDGYLGLARRGA
jgi:hypothetical protein